MLLCRCVPSNVTTLAAVVGAAGIAAGAWYLYNRFLESRGIVRRDRKCTCTRRTSNAFWGQKIEDDIEYQRHSTGSTNLDLGS